MLLPPETDKTTDRLYMSDIFALIKRRRVLFWGLFGIGLAAGMFLKLSLFAGTHVEQSIYIRNQDANPDYAHLLHLRYRFLNDPYILNEILQDLPQASLTMDGLKRHLFVKILALGGFVAENGRLSERYEMGLSVRHRNEKIARQILSRWVDLALQDIENVNRIMTDAVAQDEKQIKALQEKEAALAKSLFPAEDPLLSHEKLRILFRANETLRRQLATLLAEARKRRPLDSLTLAYLGGQLNVHYQLRQSFHTLQKNLLTTYQDRVTQLKQRISAQKAKILEVIPAVTTKTLLTKNDNLFQALLIGLGLGFFIALGGIFLTEGMRQPPQ